MDDNGEASFRCRDAVLFGYDAEVVVAWSHVAERDFVDTGLHTYPFFMVDAVSVDDMLWVVVGQRRQLNGKGVVAWA